MVALVAVVATATTAAYAVTSPSVTSTSTTTTTVAAPNGATDTTLPPGVTTTTLLVPPLVVPLDTSTAADFAQAAAAARARLVKAQTAVTDSRTEALNLTQRINATEAKRVAARTSEVIAAKRLSRTQDLVRKYAAAQYEQASVPSDPSILSSASPVEASRRDTLDAAAGKRFSDVMKSFVAQRDAAEHRRRAAAAELTNLADESKRSNTRIRLAATELVAATNASYHTTMLIAEAADPAPTIMGPSALTATELVAWYKSLGYDANSSVPIETLAADYLEEGNLAGVRGDMAWAQSVIETGSFTFPGGGLVAGQDNNFAGIGACDSCAHGNGFPSALIGVRAQMQALRIYADPFVTLATIGAPLVMPGGVGIHGKVQTWNELAGTWASAKNYGIAIHKIYAEVVAWVLKHPQPIDPAANPTTGTTNATTTGTTTTTLSAPLTGTG
jgi:hypothetical protein